MEIKGRQISESFFLGALLAIVGGFLDAYTYLVRGNVFANAQTGNIVLLGISLTNREFTKSFLYILPILAFGLGVLLSNVIRRKFLKHPYLHWRQIVILLEIFILLGASFVPQGNLDTLVNILVSFICAMQAEGFRKVNGNAYATTMCTGNLKSAMENLYHYGETKEWKFAKNCLQYLGVILFFIVGAGLGTVSVAAWNVQAVLVCCALLGIAFLLMFLPIGNKH